MWAEASVQKVVEQAIYETRLDSLRNTEKWLRDRGWVEAANHYQALYNEVIFGGGNEH